MQSDISAARLLFKVFNRVLAISPGFPAYAMFWSKACTPTYHGHLIGRNKGGIKADSKLTNQMRVFFLITGQLRKKLASTRFGNRPQMFYNVFPAHANPIVTDRQRTRLTIVTHLNLQI